jgi:hypothetical protein
MVSGLDIKVSREDRAFCARAPDDVGGCDRDPPLVVRLHRDVRQSAWLTDEIPVGGLEDRRELRKGKPGHNDTLRIGQRLRAMSSTSRDQIVVVSIMLVAALSAPIVYGVVRVDSARSIETSVATVAPVIAPSGSEAPIAGSAELATAQPKANAVATSVAMPSRSLDGHDSDPVFDIVRVDRTGDAVVAGRATPGAIVELLLNGDRRDQAVANQAGQFVMVPPQLSPGNYELTLRSRQSDGRQATSKQSVLVLVNEIGSAAGEVRSQPDMLPRIR